MSTNCFSTLLDNLVCIDVCLVNCCFWSFVSRFNRLFERLSVTVVLYNIFESGQRCLVRVMCAKLGLFRKTFFLVTLCNCSSSFFKRSSCSRIILLFSSTIFYCSTNCVSVRFLCSCNCSSIFCCCSAKCLFRCCCCSNCSLLRCTCTSNKSVY